jgi:MFS family permease
MLGGMRRLLVVVSVTVFADTMLFSAIVPLLPGLTDGYDLSKFEAGLLVGAYGAGAMIGGIPAGLLAARIGPKKTVVLGLLTLAVATAAFAFGSSAVGLGSARFVQGIASAVTWSGALAWLTLTAPRARRGQLLGTVFSFAVLGFIVGPAVGALAELTSIRDTFAVIAVTTLLIAGLTGSLPAAPSEVQHPGALRRALRDVGFLSAVWLVLVPALFFGLLDVLVPLALDSAGWGTIAIAATFIGAGLIEVALAPAIGGLSDRRGRLYPIRVGLVLLAATALVFAVVTPALLIAVLVVGGSLAASGIYTPSIALVSDRAEAGQMPQSLAFGFMNTAWAVGAMIGPSGGGALAEAIGDPAPYIVCAGLALLSLIVVNRPGLAPRPA